MENTSKKCFLTTRKLLFIGLVFMSIITPAIHAGMMHNLLNRAKSLLGFETCEHPHVHGSTFKRFKTALKNELFGQHVAAEIVLKAVKAHLEDSNPQKALVLSLHGWAGAGKTFTALHLMNSMYEKGINSSFVRFFLSSYHFPDPEKTQEYQNLIRDTIQQVVKQCPRALFVFDEVDKIPPGVLDAVTPFIHHPGEVLDGVNYKRAIFIMLSNIGANDIVRITQTAWKEGRRREDLNFKDFDDALSSEAFNSKFGGLYRSRMIDRILVDYFIPFLPLERRHIIQCAKVEAKRHGIDPSVIDEQAEKVADLTTYWPADVKLYSTTGCKKVDTYVKLLLGNESEMDLSDEEEDEIDKMSKTEF